MKTKNVVYGIYNEKTNKMVYVGMTTQPLEKRMQAHVRDVKKAIKTTKLVQYFNSEVQSVDDMRVVVLEKVDDPKDLHMKEMETVLKYDMVNSGANMRYPISPKKYQPKQ